MPPPYRDSCRTYSQKAGETEAFIGFPLALRKHREEDAMRGAAVPIVQPHLSRLSPPKQAVRGKAKSCSGAAVSGRIWSTRG